MQREVERHHVFELICILHDSTSKTSISFLGCGREYVIRMEVKGRCKNFLTTTNTTGQASSCMKGCLAKAS